MRRSLSSILPNRLSINASNNILNHNRNATNNIPATPELHLSDDDPHDTHRQKINELRRKLALRKFRKNPEMTTTSSPTEHKDDHDGHEENVNVNDVNINVEENKEEDHEEEGEEDEEEKMATPNNNNNSMDEPSSLWRNYPPLIQKSLHQIIIYEQMMIIRIKFYSSHY